MRFKYIAGVAVGLSLLAATNAPKQEYKLIEGSGELINPPPIVWKAEIKLPENIAALPQLPEAQEVIEETGFDVPLMDCNGFKAYMDYRTITDKTSTQWQMQQAATTDENGLRVYEGRYLIAIGTYYADSCGKKLDVELDSGEVIPCIVGDIRQDIHTDELNQYTPVCDGKACIVEFIVDVQNIPKKARLMGDISYCGFFGNITAIREEV